MTLDKLLEKFPPNEGQSWHGYLQGFEWGLEPDSLFGWKLSITFWISGKGFCMQGIVKGDTFRDALQESLLWMRGFQYSISKLQENLKPLSIPTALERIAGG
jgi:hypothetical protein